MTLAQARKALGLTQIELARILGLSRRQWQIFEAGTDHPPPWLIFALRWLLSDAGRLWLETNP